MKRGIFTLGLVAFSMTTLAVAQDSSPVGKYTGQYEAGSGTRVTITIVLDIKSVQNGEVTGIAHRYSTARRAGQCTGEYPVVGTLKDNTLLVKSTEKGGAAADCSLSLSGVVDGGKIQAKLGSNDFVMTK